MCSLMFLQKSIIQFGVKRFIPADADKEKSPSAQNNN